MLLNVITSAVTAVAKASAASAKPAATSGGSSGSSGGGTSSWQSSMQKTAAGGQAAIQAEIDRAKVVMASGKGTEATTRYLNQMNALKDGKPLADVMKGKYDGYSVDKGGTYNNGVYQGPGTTNNSAPAPSYGTPEWYADQVNLQQQFMNNVAKNQAGGDTSYQQYLEYKSANDLARSMERQDYLLSAGAAAAGMGEDQWFELAKKAFLALMGIGVLGIVAKFFGK